MMNQIGLIGIGVMGSNIALNLSDKNFEVKVFNIMVRQKQSELK